MPHFSLSNAHIFLIVLKAHRIAFKFIFKKFLFANPCELFASLNFCFIKFKHLIHVRESELINEDLFSFFPFNLLKFNAPACLHCLMCYCTIIRSLFVELFACSGLVSNLDTILIKLMT
jgi:hypothetical protein